MHSCNKQKLVISTLVIALTVSSAYSQNSTKNPAPVKPVAEVPGMKGISMPEMPSLSAPMSSTSYYTPGQRNKNTKATQSQETQSQNPQNITEALPGITSETYLSQLNNLSAADLASMSQQGSLSSLTSLLGGTPTALNSPSQNQNAVLNQILKELNEIKANQKNLSMTDSAKSRPSCEPPAILRFVVNNQDILRSCSSVFFSSPENDGSFLLTGDCKTLYNNSPLAETFYILFKSCGTDGGHNIYQVELNLSQSTSNKNSALYRFCSQQNLTASKTGNLVTLRSSVNGINSDILLDVGR